MPWPAAIFLGLLTGLIGGIYAGLVADRAAPWLRISSFEGGSGYFVVFMALLGFLGSTIAGITTCRLAGEPGGAGIARGFGAALLVVGGLITAAGLLAWAQRDVQPLVGGQPIDLALELRLPAGAERPAPEPAETPYVHLSSGPNLRSSMGDWNLEEARFEDGHWIVPGRVPVTISQAPRILTVGRFGPESQYVSLPVPARPGALEEAWSPWIGSYLGSGSPDPAEASHHVRYRVVRRPPPAPPPPAPPSAAALRQAAFAALAPDAPTAAFLDFAITDGWDEVRTEAIRIATARPDFAAAIVGHIAGPDAAAAREAMYIIGEMRPAPAELGDAVRARAAEVVRIAEAIDPAAEDSRDRLYAEAHELAIGVVAASFGLRAAGVDLRPELRAMAEACRPREKAPPHAIADTAERVARFFEQEGQ
ncbi:hypothetical protein GXW74_14010 [Roseomonas eburnea]|uniref:Uncharacterized protein n=1 Tax=Neoroseomonas eburnea TaxID=1346889 RepID=A0A9X9XD21_9PROT|nr:hypothetical protein [Neoroseomonas eburnea]MBR0681607.1 hypothetical protein [Neoroseomonas eburnea]